MNCDAITGICAVFVVIIALCVFLFCLGYRSSGDLGQALAKAMQDSNGEDDSEEDDSDEYDSKEDDPDLHFGILHLVDRDGEPLESGEQSPSGDRVLDADDFLNLGLLSEEAEDDKDGDDNDLFAETLVRIATIEDYDGFVNDMLEKTSKIMKHITNIQVALKREEDEDNTNLFIALRHHLQQQMQDYHDIVETVNKYVGRNVDYTDAVVAIEEEIAKVEGYNL